MSSWSKTTSKSFVTKGDLMQCSRFFKRTYVYKNTDLIRTHFFFKYRPNTDPILAQLKKIQTYYLTIHKTQRIKKNPPAPCIVGLNELNIGLKSKLHIKQFISVKIYDFLEIGLNTTLAFFWFLSCSDFLFSITFFWLFSCSGFLFSITFFLLS